MVDILKRTLLFRGDRVLTVSQSGLPATTHAMATVSVASVPLQRALGRASPEIALGAGIYACFFEGRLFYIGIFAGNGSKMTGNVIKERWRKHVGCVTLSGRHVTVCRSTISQIRANNSAGELRGLILATPVNVMSKDKGLQATYGKYRFASENWCHFRNLDNTTMSLFQFAYIRFGSGCALANLDKAYVKRHLKSVETCLVRRFRPPCNNGSCNDGLTRDGIRKVVRTIRMLLSKSISEVAAEPGIR